MSRRFNRQRRQYLLSCLERMGSTSEFSPFGVLIGLGWRGDFGGLVPVAGHGEVDGRPFFFRARGSKWSLAVATNGGDPVDVSLEAAAGFHHEGEYGPWPAAGYMPEAAVRAAMEEAVTAFRRWWRERCGAYLDGRLEVIAALRHGWLDGEGEPVPPACIAWVRSVLLVLLTRHALPEPLLAPTPEGEVSASWHAKPCYVTADFSFFDRTAYLHVANLESKAVEHLTVSFRPTRHEALKAFAAFVHRFTSPVSP